MTEITYASTFSTFRQKLQFDALVDKIDTEP